MVKVIEKLKTGKLVVMPSDTIYGIFADALNKKAVQDIYNLKSRDFKKPFIVLIGSIDQLDLFGIKLDEFENKLLQKVWPGPISVILPCKNNKFKYLHRGNDAIAFRLPKKPTLTRLLMKTGPLVSTSVNSSGEPPAMNIKQAKEYFGDKVGLYISGRVSSKKPSKVIKIENGKIVVIRK